MKTIYKNSLAGLFAVAFSVQSNAQDAATIPFEIGPRSHILIPVSINGSDPKTFVFDTGSGKTVINLTQQDDFLLDESTFITAKAHGVHGMYDITLVDLGEISLSPQLTQKNIKQAAILDLSDIEAEPGSENYMQLWGILGYDYFKNYDLSINYKNQTLSFAEPLNQNQCNAMQGQEFKLVAGTAIAFDMMINGTVVEALLDTGSPISGINLHAATALSGQPMPEDHDRPQGHDQPGHGETVEVLGQANVAKMATGQKIFSENLELNIIDLPVFKQLGISEKPGMIIGNDLLGDKIINISYSCKKISFG